MLSQEKEVMCLWQGKEMRLSEEKDAGTAAGWEPALSASELEAVRQSSSSLLRTEGISSC